MAIQLKQCLLGLIAMVYFGVVAAECDMEMAKLCYSDAGLISQESFFDVSCEDKDKAAKALTCMLTKAVECYPIIEPLMPSSDAIEKATEILLCTNSTKMNPTCVEKKIQELDLCIKEEGRKISVPVKPEDGKPLPQKDVCPISKVIASCVKKITRSCGCQASKNDVELIDDLLSCPALDVHVTCSTENPNDFADGGATGIYSFWTWNILIVFLFAVTWSRLY